MFLKLFLTSVVALIIFVGLIKVIDETAPSWLQITAVLGLVLSAVCGIVSVIGFIWTGA